MLPHSTNIYAFLQAKNKICGLGNGRRGGERYNRLPDLLIPQMNACPAEPHFGVKPRC